MTTDDATQENSEALAAGDGGDASPNELREVRRFDADLIKMARMLWATRMFHSDAQIQKALGIKEGRVLHNWRKHAQPDGQDWYAFREQFGALSGGIVEWEPGVSELEVRHRFLDYAGRIAATAMAALDQTEWFDKDGNRMTHLYRYDPNGDLVRTKLSGFGPTGFSQIGAALKQAAEITDRQMAGMDQIKRLIDDREAEQIRIAAELGRRLADGGSPLTEEQRRILVTVEREARGEEEMAPEPGALPEGVIEGDDDLDDDFEDDD
jgi:hypothetical protein